MCFKVIDALCPDVSAIGQGIAKAGFDFILQGFTDAVAKAATDLLSRAATEWLLLPDPDVTQSGGPVWELQSYTLWLTEAVAVGALMIAAIRIFLQRDGREFAVIARGLIWLSIASVTAAPAVALVLAAGSSYSDWILNAAAGGKAQDKFAGMAKDLSKKTGGGVALLLVVILLFILLIAALLQTVLFMGRSVGVVLLTGLFPLAAASALTSGGIQMRQRYLTWLAAFVLYKPTAATIYAASFWIASSKQGSSDEVITAMTGVLGVLMASVALPALQRLIAPVVAGGTAAFSSKPDVMAGTSMSRSAAKGALDVIRQPFPRGSAARGGGSAAGGSRVMAGANKIVATGALVVASTVVVATAATNAVRKIGKTAASGIDEEDY